MNAVLPQGVEPVTGAPDATTWLNRGQLCHFLELALAHPGEDGHAYFREEATERAFLDACSGLPRYTEELSSRGEAAARRFFDRLRTMSYEDVESAHIGLFANNYPHLPCPPYGSLFTALDGDKRLEEMLAIKQFYKNSGVDIANSFNDLPDHLCVEIEFLQLLCYRADEAVRCGNAALLAEAELTAAAFMDRFLLPFANRLADIAVGTVPENPYSDLLEVTRCVLLRYRSDLGIGSESIASAFKEDAP